MFFKVFEGFVVKIHLKSIEKPGFLIVFRYLELLGLLDFLGFLELLGPKPQKY